jgi:hypothetical protein
MKRRIANTQKRWREVINRQRTSGLSIKDFCEQRGINGPGFYVWRKRLGMSDGKAKNAPIAPAGQCGEEKPAKRLTNGFMRLVPPAGSKEISIETPNGYKVNGGQAGLKEVLEALRAL